MVWTDASRSDHSRRYKAAGYTISREKYCGRWTNWYVTSYGNGDELNEECWTLAEAKQFAEKHLTETVNQVAEYLENEVPELAQIGLVGDALRDRVRNTDLIRKVKTW